MSRVMALRHDLASCPEEFPGIRQGNDKASPCRRSSVAWLQERRFHLNFRRFQSVAGADGKASLHNISFLLLSDYTLSSFYSFTTLTIFSSILPFLNRPALYTHFLLKMIYCFLLLFHSHLICYEVPQL